MTSFEVYVSDVIGRRFEDWTSIRDWTSIWVTYILGTVTIPRPHDLVNCYGISVSQITTYIFRCSNPNPILSLFMTWVCNTRSVTCGVWLPFRRTSDYSQCRLKFMFRGVSHVESDLPTLRRTSDYPQCTFKFVFREVSHVESDLPTLPDNIRLPPV